MSDRFTKRFNGSQGHFSVFQLKKDEFLIRHGQGKEMKFTARYPLKTAREIAFSILQMTGGYQEVHGDKAPVQKAFGNQGMTEKRIDQAIRNVIDEAPDKEKYENVEKVLNGASLGKQYKRAGLEKIRQDVVQDIYDNFGFEWFVASDFRKVYESKYDKGQYGVTLNKLYKGDWIRKDDEIPESMNASGYCKYRYKLSGKARDVIEEYGDITSDENEFYRRKKVMKEQPVEG